MDVFKVMVNNLFKENFYEKKKKVINILTVFFISHKTDAKTFPKWIVKHFLKGTC